MTVFHLQKQWFDKIKSGEKTHEYRVCSRYWNVRINKLLNQGIVEVMFACGYPPSDKKSDKFLKATVKSITKIDGMASDLRINRKVWDIEFELMR